MLGRVGVHTNCLLLLLLLLGLLGLLGLLNVFFPIHLKLKLTYFPFIMIILIGRHITLQSCHLVFSWW